MFRFILMYIYISNKMIVIYLLIICSFTILGIDSWEKRTMTQIHRFDICGCPRQCIVQDFECIILNKKRADSILSIKCRITEDVPSIRISVKAQKCRNKELLDSCEDFGNTIKPIDTCVFLSMRKTSWEHFVYNFKPPLTCPFRKGNYVSDNATLDADITEILPIAGWFWRLSVDFYNGSATNVLWTACMDARVIKLK